MCEYRIEHTLVDLKRWNHQCLQIIWQISSIGKDLFYTIHTSNGHTQPSFAAPVAISKSISPRYLLRSDDNNRVTATMLSTLNP